MPRNGAVSNPGPVAGLSFAVFALLWASMVLSIGLWVFRDARARGSGRPRRWALASVFTPIGLPYHLYRRRRRAGIGDRSAPPNPFSLLASTVAFLVPTLLLAYVLVSRGGYRVAAERVGL